MLRPDTLALTALLALLTAVGPMSVDLYLPSLPEIGRVFGASVPQVQLTLSGYLFFFAVGQIVYGPISDHVGRKPVLLAALALYLAVCLGCVFAASIEMLIALRCLQALGVAAAPVLARAIVRDQSSRWGSCSNTGVLSFSWRLILAPPFVLDYLAAHEVCHLVELNHSLRFWRLVKRLYPNVEPAKAWLDVNGTDLHRYGLVGRRRAGDI